MNLYDGDNVRTFQLTEEMSIGHYLKRMMVIVHLFGNDTYYLNKYIES